MRKPPSSHYLYMTWSLMHQRCNNPKVPNYPIYGGRGIGVCSRWDNFWYFIEDMGDRPNGTTLDRRDNNGDYTPENCRWVNGSTQRLNQRIRTDNTSGYICVYTSPYKEGSSIHKASFTVGHKTLHFGWYEDPINAAYIVDQARIDIFGPDTPTNFIGENPRYPDYIDT